MHYLLQLLIEPPQGKSYYVVVISLDLFYMDGEISLYSVCAGFVQRVAGFHVDAQVVLVDRVEGHVCLFVKCIYGSFPVIFCNEGNAGVDLDRKSVV